MGVAEGHDFLPSLTAAFTQLDHSVPISTQDFAAACEKVLPIFEHIGRWAASLRCLPLTGRLKAPPPQTPQARYS